MVSFIPSFGHGEKKPAELYHSGGHDMARKERIVKRTDKELRAMQERGESESNWEKASAMTEEEIEAAIADDQDETGMVVDWSKASIELPQPKAVLNMRVDYEVLQFFRNQGKGYQTKINAVLRSYVDQRMHHDRG
ncbi:MAG: BrnA antitoxin family protein [Chlorobium sp.]